MSIDASIFQGLSWNLASDVRELFAYHFIVNALEAGTSAAVMAGALGWVMGLHGRVNPCRGESCSPSRVVGRNRYREDYLRALRSLASSR